MIKNGKFFSHPPNDTFDFKELFKRTAAAGVGRPVDRGGFPQGQWTPDLIAEAIIHLDGKGEDVDLRTIQFWYQDNDKGISSTNIRWLARIFGCDDPVATSEWQVELTAAQSRLVSKRREAKRPEPLTSLLPETDSLPLGQEVGVFKDTRGRRKEFGSLAIISEHLFSGSQLNISSLVFAGAVALGFMSYFLGIHDVPLNTTRIGVKQVVFLWAPNWTLLFMVLFPVLLALVSELLRFWKEEGSLVWGDR
jgi:hypothetical protein